MKRDSLDRLPRCGPSRPVRLSSQQRIEISLDAQSVSLGPQQALEDSRRSSGGNLKELGCDTSEGWLEYSQQGRQR